MCTLKCALDKRRSSAALIVAEGLDRNTRNGTRALGGGGVHRQAFIGVVRFVVSDFVS
jgi:hypothetical protein